MLLLHLTLCVVRSHRQWEKITVCENDYVISKALVLHFYTRYSHVYGLSLTVEKITLNLLNLDAVHQGDNLKHLLIKIDFQISVLKS